MKSVFFLLLSFLTIYSCTKNTNNGVDTVYFNSFESVADTIDWSPGFCSVELADDVPPNGEEQSLSVSCGCIGPFVSTEIGPYQEDLYVVLSFWGKASGMGGSVHLSNSSYESIGIYIGNEYSDWEYFDPSDTLFCPAGENLKLSLSAGGIAAGQIGVDLVTIKKVDIE